MISVRLTVAIATLNRPHGLARCLEALLSGESLPDEVIVVDQSEDEKSRGVVEQCGQRGVPIRYIRQARRGLSASRNEAFLHSRCPIVAATDDDCVPDHRWVSAVKKTFSSEAAPDAMTGRILPLGPEVPGFYAVSSRDSPVSRIFQRKVVPWLIGSGGNFAVKREWFDRIGGHDERLGAGSPGMAAEDADLFYRLLEAGARIRYEPGAVIYHERQNIDRRRASYWTYGYGVGAFCGLRVRRGDVFAVRVFGGWLGWHVWHLILEGVRLQWKQTGNVLLSLGGTARGFIYGLFVR